jgi:hypothetical protein
LAISKWFNNRTTLVIKYFFLIKILCNIFRNDHYLPNLFSLSHPLDEVKPIISRHHGEWFYSSDKHVYTSAGLAIDEQLLLRFDEIDRVHSLWLLRKCTDEVNCFLLFFVFNLISLLKKKTKGSSSSNKYDITNVK